MTEEAVFVKAFIEKIVDDRLQHEVVNTPAGSLEEARTLFDAYYADVACQATYIYRGDRVVASWDRHADYLVAIGDIQPEDELQYHRYLYLAEVQP